MRYVPCHLSCNQPAEATTGEEEGAARESDPCSPCMSRVCITAIYTHLSSFQRMAEKMSVANAMPPYFWTNPKAGKPSRERFRLLPRFVTWLSRVCGDTVKFGAGQVTVMSSL